MFKLIATDMDGTFLRDDMTYDRDLLRRYMKKCKRKAFSGWWPVVINTFS